MEQRQIFRRSRVIVAAFALLFLIAVSSSVILLSDDELSAEEIGGINYTLNSPSSGKATVVAITGGYSGDIVIPATVSSGGSTYTVSNIAASAFFENKGLTSVTIGSQVSAIGTSAFEGCTALTSVDFDGALLTTLNTKTFKDCISLGHIAIPSQVSVLGTEVFLGCTGLTSVDFDGTLVKIITTSTFRNCTSLTSITIPDQVTTIHSSAFSGCSSLTSITIPDQVNSIGAYVFEKCTALTSVIFEGSLMEAITQNTFQGCTSLEDITIPSLVHTIGSNAFDGCSSLEEITIPSLVHTIGYNAFSGCTNLETVIFEGSLLTAVSQQLFKNCSSLTSITIPKAATTMGSDVFSGCTALTSVLFETPSSLGNIGYGSFAGTPITSITIPKSVTSIDNTAFSGCADLTSVSFEDSSSLTTIGVNSFTSCTNLASITIPKSVTSLLDQAFMGCIGLTSLEFEGPASLTKISNSAFSGCKGLTSVLIPDSITEISGYAFSGCTNIASVTIPNSVTTIGGNAFYSCPIRTLKITYAAGSKTSEILGASFNWRISGQNGEVSDLIIDASDLSIPTIIGKTGKSIIFTENATETTEGSLYDPDGPALMTGSARANKIYKYDTAAAKWFALKHTVTFEVNGGIPVPDGRVFDGDKQADPGTPVRYGYVFGGWFSDSDFIYVYDFSTPVTSDFTLYAKWSPEFLNPITSSAGPGGWIDPLGPQEVPFDGITFSFKGDAGYRIKDVKVDGVSVSCDVDPNGLGTYSFRDIEEEHTIFVEFEAYHTVSVNNPANGNAEASDYAPVHGGSVTVTVRSNVGYTLDVLTDNGGDVLASAVMTEEGVWTYTLASVTSDHVIFAAFVKITYEMTVDHSGEGTLDPDSSFTVEYGDNVTFVFKADEGHHISDVLVDGVAVAYDTDADGTGSYSFLSIADNHTFEVIFALNTYDVILVPGDGYTLTPAEGSSSPVNEKGSFAFVFSLNEGYDNSVPAILMNGTEIVTLSSGQAATIVLLNIIEDAEITVSGIAANVYTVTVTSEEGMAFTYTLDEDDPVEFIMGSDGSYGISAPHGSVLVIEAVSGEGRQFLWTKTGAGTVDGNVLTINVEGDVTVGGSLKDPGIVLTGFVSYAAFFVAMMPVLLLFALGRTRFRL